MVENLNPKYKFFGNDYDALNIIKQHIDEIPYNDLLDLCPIITIPRGTIIYHSNKYTSVQLVQELIKINKTGHYDTPKMQGNPITDYQGNICQCDFIKPIPTERIGNKPRMSEIANNPTATEKGSCTCNRGRNQRLYGNFNFVGNYSVELGSDMRGTQILIVNQPMRLIDLSYISIELGFSPKNFNIVTGQNKDGTLKVVKGGNNFAKTSNYSTYCKKHGLDGLIMIDPVDQQANISTQQESSSILSCYKLSNNTNVCPEVVLLNELGDRGNILVGTDKLSIIGMVDMYVTGISDIKLSRDQVADSINRVFTKYLLNLRQNYPNAQMTLQHTDNNLFKVLKISNDNQDLDISHLNVNAMGSSVFIKGNDTTPLLIDLYQSERQIQRISRTHLMNMPQYYEIYSPLIIHQSGIIPYNSENYCYMNGERVVGYISDKLYYYLLNYIGKISTHPIIYHCFEIDPIHYRTYTDTTQLFTVNQQQHADYLIQTAKTNLVTYKITKHIDKIKQFVGHIDPDIENSIIQYIFKNLQLPPVLATFITNAPQEPAKSELMLIYYYYLSRNFDIPNSQLNLLYTVELLTEPLLQWFKQEVVNEFSNKFLTRDWIVQNVGGYITFLNRCMPPQITKLSNDPNTYSQLSLLIFQNYISDNIKKLFDVTKFIYCVENNISKSEYITKVIDPLIVSIYIGNNSNILTFIFYKYMETFPSFNNPETLKQIMQQISNVCPKYP